MMQVILQTGLSPTVVNTVWRTFISLARGEEHLPDRYTDQQLAADVRKSHPDEWAMCGDVVWSGSRRVMKAIEVHRGLTKGQQYERGIISMLTRIQGLLISYEMRKIFGQELLSRMPHFDENGEFLFSSRHDFMYPLLKDGKITGLRFCTLAEMKKWGKVNSARKCG